jgi:flagellar biosynthesis protein FlhG
MKRLLSARTICITSGKGGVGKTSFAVNLSLSLVGRGYRVLLIDGDLGLANVDLLLGLSVQKTIRDVVHDGGGLRDSICFPRDAFGVLPATSGVPEMVDLGPEEQGRLGAHLQAVSEDFDYVLIDTAAGIGASVLWFTSIADEVVILLTPDPTSITDAYAMMKVLSQKYARKAFRLVLNNVSDVREGLGVFNNLKAVAEKFLSLELMFLGAIPHDPDVSRAIREQVPFLQRTPDGDAARAVASIAEKLQGPGASESK